MLRSRMRAATAATSTRRPAAERGAGQLRTWMDAGRAREGVMNKIGNPFCSAPLPPTYKARD